MLWLSRRDQCGWCRGLRALLLHGLLIGCNRLLNLLIMSLLQH